MSDRPAWSVGLVDDLVELADLKNPNRAALAHLRRGLDHSLDYPLGRVGWLFRRVPDSALQDAVLAAGLFAWVKGDCPLIQKVNFGAAFGTGLTIEGKQQREKRFIDLLDTDANELSYKLRQAMTLIARDGVGLDWVLLIRHLGHWGHPDRWVQKEWARGFWTAAETETTADSEQSVSK
jgi:CRISPR type I-E-associated protein CasB/Cse2